MKYFESFPKTSFLLDSDIYNRQAVTNIFARSTFLREIVNNTAAAYEYIVKDSDTPEVIAHKVYGDSYRSWIVLLFNNIINPYYDWPMRSDALDNYIISKYGQDLDTAKSTIHHYEKVTTKTASYNGLVIDKEVTTQALSEYSLNHTTNAIYATPSLPSTADTSLLLSNEEISYPTYNLSIQIVHKAVSNYAYELEENEKRRTIKLLDERYVQQVETEFRKLMSNV
jgi:hypothetical protein